MMLQEFKTDDGQLQINEHSKGYVTITTGRLDYVSKSDNVTLSCLDKTYYLLFAGISLDLNYWEFKELLNSGFGFNFEDEA